MKIFIAIKHQEFEVESITYSPSNTGYDFTTQISDEIHGTGSTLESALRNLYNNKIADLERIEDRQFSNDVKKPNIKRK